MVDHTYRPRCWKIRGSPGERVAQEVAAEINRRRLAQGRPEAKQQLAHLLAERLECAGQFARGDRVKMPDGRTGSFVELDGISGSARIELGRRTLSFDPLVLKKLPPKS